MTRYQLDVLVAVRDGVDPAHVPHAAANAIAVFWEVVGGLARRGHLDPKLLWDGTGGDCITWWVALAPFVRRRRAEWHSQTMLENFEWLAGVMAEFDRRAGMSTFDEPSLASILERLIGNCHDRFRVEQVLRTVILQSPEAAPAAQPVATPAAQAEAAPAAPPPA